MKLIMLLIITSLGLVGCDSTDTQSGGDYVRTPRPTRTVRSVPTPKLLFYDNTGTILVWEEPPGGDFWINANHLYIRNGNDKNGKSQRAGFCCGSKKRCEGNFIGRYNYKVEVRRKGYVITCEQTAGHPYWVARKENE